MANERIALGINLRRNQNQTSRTYGKYYPEVDLQKTLSLRGFARHMTEHGCYYSRDVVEGVLMKITDCLPELLAQGVPVQLGSLGTFYPTAEVAKNAAVDDLAKLDGVNPNQLVKAIHIRFRPDSSQLDNLTGPAFKQACALELHNVVSTSVVTVDGAPRKVRQLKPVATAVAEAMSGGSGGGGGGGDDERP